MVLKKRTVIEQIEVTASGAIQVRMAKQIVDDTGLVLGQEWHRVCVEAGGDCDVAMNVVNAHLPALGFPPVALDEWMRVKAIAVSAWTPSLLAATANTLDTAIAQKRVELALLGEQIGEKLALLRTT